MPATPYECEDGPVPKLIVVFAFALTVATILGTGILALPVKLSDSGFGPFMATFTVCLLMQLFIVFFMIHLLQEAAVRLYQDAERGVGAELNEVNLLGADGERGRGSDADLLEQDRESIATRPERMLSAAELSDSEDEAPVAGSKVRTLKLSDVRLSDTSRLDGGEDVDDAAASSADAQPPLVIGRISRSETRAPLAQGPDLHLLGKLFLNRPMGIAFDTAVMLHFVAILVAYTLAGAQAYGDLLNVSFVVIIPFFALALTSLVLFGDRFLSHIIASMTMFKGGLLIVMVGIVGYVAGQVNEPTSDDWTQIGEPFLLGTLSLGGAVNTIPVVFSRVPFTRRSIRAVRAAISAGVATCWILVTLWCYFIPRVVPQTEGKFSLAEAQREGQISTHPLVEILDRDHPQYAWVSVLVKTFIVVSITVSYISMSMGFKHALDGWVKAPSERTRALLARIRSKACFARFAPAALHQLILYVPCFGFILFVAWINPGGFLLVLETFGTLVLNLESGAFLAYMVLLRFRAGFEPVPLPLDSWVRHSCVPVALYFLFAVAYDVVVFFTKL